MARFFVSPANRSKPLAVKFIVISPFCPTCSATIRGSESGKISMHLSPREIDKLLLHNAGFLAQKRLARGLRLNHPEAVALIATVILEFIRDGKSVAELMNLGRQLLGRNQVMPGVPEMIYDVQVEGTFPDGSKLVTVHHPIASENWRFETRAAREFSASAGCFDFQTGCGRSYSRLNGNPRRRNRTQRRSRDSGNSRHQSRRPADSSRQPLSFHRDERVTEI